MQARRYLVKMTKIYTVYDLVTGQVIGDSFSSEVNKAVLKPKGLDIEDKAEAATFKNIGDHDAYHSAVAQIRWSKYLK